MLIVKCWLIRRLSPFLHIPYTKAHQAHKLQYKIYLQLASKIREIIQVSGFDFKSQWVVFFKSLLRALWDSKGVNHVIKDCHRHVLNVCSVPSTNVIFTPHINMMGIIVFISSMRQLICDHSEVM